MSTKRFRESLLLASAVFAGCGGVTSADPIPTVVLSVTVTVPATEAQIAQQLGWVGRAVPGAVVELRREALDGSLEVPVVDTTDAAGVATFPKIVSGTHRIAVSRMLTPAEIGVVEGVRPTLRVFAGAGRVIGANQNVPIELDPNRTNGLVISELSTVDNAGGDGLWFGYVELYNNSQNTVFLDGRVLGRALQSSYGSDILSCGARLLWTNQPDGLWARFWQRFPGSGTEHPVLPGETILIAFDAIDHSVIRPWQLDLTGADFEFRTQSDADNPAVPDLIDDGTHAALQGGIQLLYGTHAPFLANAVDKAALPSGRPLTPLSDDIFALIPAGAVIDVFDQMREISNAPAPICETSLHESFERHSYVWKHGVSAHLMSQQRRAVGTAPGGWVILLDTNTSQVDFMEALRTPDAVPVPEGS